MMEEQKNKMVHAINKFKRHFKSNFNKLYDQECKLKDALIEANLKNLDQLS